MHHKLGNIILFKPHEFFTSNVIIGLLHLGGEGGVVRVCLGDLGGMLLPWLPLVPKGGLFS